MRSIKMTVRFLAIGLILFGIFGCEGTLDMSDLESEQTALDAQPVVSSPQPTATPLPTDPGPADTPTTEEPTEELPEPVAEPEPEPEVPTRPGPGTVVEFTIQQGTGASDWNSKDEPVVVYVGQILRITNFDDRDHQLHSPGDGPVDHSSRIRPGESLNLEVMRPQEQLGDQSRLYDHADGRSASFWLVSHP